MSIRRWGREHGLPCELHVGAEVQVHFLGFVLDPSSCVCPVASKISVFPLIFEVVIGERARIVTGPEVLLQQGRGVANLAWGLAAPERQGGELKARFMFHQGLTVGEDKSRSPI